MTIRAVIFDFGGVLVRTEDHTARRQLAESLGMSYRQLSDLVFDNESARLATVGEVSTAEHWETIRNKLGLSPEEFSRVPEGFWGGDALDTELVDYLRDLKDEYQTALLSNAWDDLRQAIEDYWRISDAFDQIFISAEVGMRKPDPAIYHHVLDQLGVEPHQAVFVDDFIENVQAARAVGMHAIHFQGAPRARAALDQLLNRE